MKTYKVKFSFVDGFPLYEVPIEIKDDVRGPRIPDRVGATIYYPTNKDNVCVVAVSKGGDTYLSKRKYARKIGTALYHPGGYDHFDFVL